MEFDTTTIVIIGTLIVGVMGALVLFASQPGPTKKRSAQGGLRPRGEWRTCAGRFPSPRANAHVYVLTQATVIVDRRGPVRAVMTTFRRQ